MLFVGQQQRDLEKLRIRQHKGINSETTDVTVPDSMLGRLGARSRTCTISIHLQHMSSADLPQHKPERAAWHQTETCETEPAGGQPKCCMVETGPSVRWTPEAVDQERRLSFVMVTGSLLEAVLTGNTYLYWSLRV